MWENAAPEQEGTKQEGVKPRGNRRTQKPKDGQDLIFWAQLLLSLAVLAVVLLGRAFELPYNEPLRVALTAALEANELPSLLSSERNFVKFTEQAAATLRPAAASGRIPHAKVAYAVGGHSDDAYLPAFLLRFPLQGRYALSSGYGPRTDPMGGEETDYHLGNDYAAATGTPVYAAADGVVRRAAAHTSYGNYLRVLHPSGDETLYAHMQYLFVRSGQRVSAGECLGTVGETGNATGPHLHFELLHGGVRYDPAKAIAAALQNTV